MTTATKNRIVTIDEEGLALCFDEWHKRYAADPDEFDDLTPDSDDGKDCAEYLIDLINELRGNSATVGSTS